MPHVSILIPHSSVLLNSVMGLFKIFDLANHHSAQEGRGAAFDLHLVGTASTAVLYGGHFVVKPDLTLAEVAATDLVLVPAMAGNIAEAIKNNSAFIPWIAKQYLTGSEIAGLCTGAFFIAETGLIHEQYGSSHWFVDATFRKQYTRINSLAEKTAAAAGSVHSDTGAWFFLQKLLERVAGKEAASACSASFQDPFNRECQSIVSVSDPRRQRAKRIAKKERSSVDSNSLQAMTAERFLSLFENHGDGEGGFSIGTLFEESLQSPAGTTNPETCCALPHYHRQGKADNQNTRTFKALFKKAECLETSYGDA